MTKQNCIIKFLEKEYERREAKQTLNKPDPIVQRIDDLFRKLNSAGSPVLENSSTLGEQSVQALKEKMRRFLKLSELSNLAPDMVDNLGFFMANSFNVKRRLANFSDELTTAGEVREALQKSGNLGRSIAEDMVATTQAAFYNTQSSVLYRQMKSKYRIPGREFDELRLLMDEVGWHPNLHAAFNGHTNPDVLAILEGRQRRLQQLVKKLGISTTDLDKLAEASNKAAQAQQQTREAIELFGGLNLGDANSPYTRYQPRQFSADGVGRVYRRKKRDEFVDLLNPETKQNTLGLFLRSRTTAYYVPEDSVLLDLVFREKFGDNFYEQISEVIKKPVNSIDDLLEDNRAFANAFVEYIDDQDSELYNQLVDAGLVHKIPWTSLDLYEYHKVKYKLPYERPGEYINVDPETRINIYTRQLQETMAKSVQSTFLAKKALDGGWGVTEAERLLQPEVYRNFVPLVGNGGIPPKFAQQFGLTGKEYRNIYVHPLAARSIRAQFEIGSNPNNAATFARAWMTYTKFIQKQQLFRPAFLARQFSGNLFYIHAASGDMTRYGTQAVRLGALLGRLKLEKKPLQSIVDYFDNTKKVYGGLTERELYQRMQDVGFLEDMLPVFGRDFASTRYTPRANPVEVATNSLRYIASTLSQFEDLGVKKTAGEIAQVINATITDRTDQLFYQLQKHAVVVDNSARISLVQSLTSTSPYDRVRRALQGNFRSPMSVDEAIEHAKKFFPSYHEIGSGDRAMQHLVPFWSFQSRNTFATFQMIARNPSRFMAYQRIYAAMNAPAREQDEDFPTGAVDDWMFSMQPLFWVNERPDGSKEFFGIPMAPIDPLAEGVNFGAETVDGVLSLIGIDSRRPNTKISDLSQETTSSLWRTIANASHPIIAQAYAGITGRDPFTNRQLAQSDLEAKENAWMFWRMSPQLEYQLQNVFPVLHNIHKSNPGGIFGRAARLDGEGNVIDTGAPNIFGQRIRDRSDILRDYRGWRQRLFSLGGIETYPIDTMFRMGNRQSEIRFRMYELEQAIKGLNRDLQNFTDPVRIREATEKKRVAEDTLFMMRYDYETIRQWGLERNEDWDTIMRKRQQNQRELQREILTEEGQLELLNEIHQDIYGVPLQ